MAKSAERREPVRPARFAPSGSGRRDESTSDGLTRDAVDSGVRRRWRGSLDGTLLTRWPTSSSSARRMTAASMRLRASARCVSRATSRTATAEAGGRSWRIARRGFWRQAPLGGSRADAASGQPLARALLACRSRPRARHPGRQGLGQAAGQGHRRRCRCDRAGAAALRGLRRPRTGRRRRRRHGGDTLGYLTELDGPHARGGARLEPEAARCCRGRASGRLSPASGGRRSVARGQTSKPRRPP
jgi:hypothetical protein